MPEYIEREELIKRIEFSINSWGRDCNSNAPAMLSAYRDVLHRVKNIPTADVVEVVRCSDCMHSTWEQEPCHGKTEYYCTKLKSKVDKHFYCGCGKRKEGVKNG